MKLSLIKSNERVDDLQCNGLKIIQNPTLYTFANDPILLVNISKIKKNAKVVDLCSGSGVIAILVAGKSRASKVFGIELQECMADMSKRSVDLNNLNDRVQIINDRIQNYNKYMDKCSIDVVFCNPPYYKKDCLKTGDNQVRNIARHELELSLEDVVKVASELLNSKGEFYLVHQSLRLQEILFLCTKYRIGVKDITFVQANNKVNPHLVLIHGVKDAGYGLIVNKNIILNNPDGSFTIDVKEMYNKKSI